jgi:hypothetical protein
MTLSNFNIGDEVRFTKEFDSNDYIENPNYMPPLPAGTAGRVILKEKEYLVVKVVNPRTNEDAIVLVWDTESSKGASTRKIDRLEVIKRTIPKCVACGAENDPKAKFCMNCGLRLQGTKPVAYPRETRICCPKCGFKVEAKHKFCISCGTRIQ